MGGSVNGIRAWLSELRRRGVFHVTGLYAVGAWAVVQLVDAISGPFPLPEAALRLIWFAALLGFPVALVFGWRYDVTKHGIVRTHRRLSHGEDVPIGRADYGVIGALALVMVGIVAMTTVGVLDAIEEARLRAELGPEIIEPQANSIAVLPFDSCSEEETEQAFARGLATEVINRLARRRMMKVMARTSAFTIAGFDLPLIEVGQRLGVTHVLTGTVCRQAGSLTISVELLDETGYVVWSETFKQAVSPSEPITVTLAAMVVDGVGTALGHTLPVPQDAPIHPLAYRHYLIGMEFEELGDRERAREEMQTALEYQPDYAEAVFAMAFLQHDDRSLVNVGTQHAEAWPYVEQALQIGEAQIAGGMAGPRTHYMMGRIIHSLAVMDHELMWRQAAELGEDGVAARQAAGTERFEEAEQHFRTAIVLNPSLTEAYRSLAINLERQSVQRRREALEILQQGLEAEPLNIWFTGDVANRLASMGRYREAIEMLEQFEALPEVHWKALADQVELMHNLYRGDDMIDKTIELLQEHTEVFQGWLFYSFLVRMHVIMGSLGLVAEADAWHGPIDALPTPPGGEVFKRGYMQGYLLATGRIEEFRQERIAEVEGLSDEDILDAWFHLAWSLADAVALAGDRARAIRLFEALRHKQMNPFWAERQTGAAMHLVGLYLSVGREADARALMGEVVAHLESEYAAGNRHPAGLSNLAVAYAHLGRRDEAVEMLERAVDYGWIEGPLDENFARASGYDPSPWHAFQDDPRFIATWDRMQANVAQQAQRARATLARHDVHALLAPVAQELAAAADEAE